MGAFFIASMSMFTSCKDYDDDINAVQTDVNALKKQVADLETARTNILSQIQTLNSQLALKLDKGNSVSNNAAEIEAMINNKTAQLQSLIDNLSAQFASYATLAQLDKAIADAKALADQSYVSKADFEKLQELVAAIEKIDPALLNQALADIQGLKTSATEAAAGLEAANAQLAEQKALIEALQKTVEDIVKDPSTVDLSAYLKIADISKYLGDYATTAQLNEKIQAIAATIPSEEAIKNAVLASLETKLNSITTLQTDVANLQSQMGAISGMDAKITDLTKFMNGINNTIISVMKANASVLTVYVSGALSSLVLQPNFYLNGIEAVGVPMLVYQPVLQIANGDYRERGNALERWVPVAKPVVTDEDIHWPEGMNLIATALAGGLDYNTLGYKFYQNFPNVHAYYHINPENSDLTGSKVQLYFNTPEVTETRATAYIDQYSIVPTPVEATVSAATANKAKATGIYDLEFQVPTQQFVNTYVKSFVDAWDAERGYGVYETTRRIPFVAAALTSEVEGTTRTVSSDWAALTPWLLHINALADNAPDIELARSWGDVDQNMVTRNHLYPSAQEAIDGEPTHEVVYDGSIDLAPFIETHYSYVATAYNKDQIMSQELMDAMGLYYEYALVDYTSNLYETSESHHAQLSDNELTGSKGHGSILYPRSVTDKGETILDKVATKEAVDREPLVRVELRAKNPGLHGGAVWSQTKLEEGEILKVGYIKLRIVETKSEVVSVAIDFEDPIYMNCPGFGILTWSQIENKILAAIEAKGMPKFDFDTEYELEINKLAPYANNGGAVRYIELDGRFMNEADYIKYLEKKYKTDNNFMIEDLVKKNVDFAHAYYKAFAGYINYTNEPSSFLPADMLPKETNVIYWVLGADHSAHAHSYMTGSTIPAEVDQAYVTYLAQPNADGESTKDIETIIRFNHKAKSNKSLFVKLRIPAGNLRYATGYLSNKNFHEWYLLNSDQPATTNINAREVHVNVPVPQLADGSVINYTQLQQRDFAVNLMQFFNPTSDGSKEHFVSFTINDEEHFASNPFIHPFYDINNGDDQSNVYFFLTTPSVAKGNIVNAANEAQLEYLVVDGIEQPAMTWTVRGWSGAYYKLAVANRLSDGTYTTSGIVNVVDNREIYEYKNLDPEIVALQRGHYIINIADDANGTATPIVSLLDTNFDWDTPGIDQVKDNPVNNEYIRMQENEIAEDIMNYKTLNRNNKREVGELEMFSAYIECVYAGACYEMYDKFENVYNTAYFNVRFQRPVNFFPLDVEAFLDAENSGTYLNFMDFLEQGSTKHFQPNANTTFAFHDWRWYPIIRDLGTSCSTFNGANAVPAKVYKLNENKQFVLWSYYNVLLNTTTLADGSELHNGSPQWGYIYTKDLIRYIRTDAGLAKRDRLDPDTPEGRAAIHALPLAASRKYGIIPDDGLGNAGLNLALGEDASTKGLLHYQNNKGNTEDFHLYVPIYWHYVLGESDFWQFPTSASGWDYFCTGAPFDDPAMTYGVITVKYTRDWE